MSRRTTIIGMIEVVAQSLGGILDQFVFVGGAASALLITDLEVGDVRPTDDVDVVVAVASRVQYSKLQEDLRKRGFQHDMEGPLCRFKINGIIVDVMPDKENILGFNNRWYSMVLETAQEYELPSGTRIRIISGPAFLCTKIEAFLDRGHGDYFGSHDLEDIVAVIDGRSAIIIECAAVAQNIRGYLSDQFSALLADPEFVDALSGLLPLGSQVRAQTLTQRIKQLAAG